MRTAFERHSNRSLPMDTEAKEEPGAEYFKGVPTSSGLRNRAR